MRVKSSGFNQDFIKQFDCAHCKLALERNFMPANVEMGAVAGVGPILAAAPAMEISSIVNEGPVGSGFRLENTMPYKIGEITFDKPVIARAQPEAINTSVPEVFIKAFEEPVVKAIPIPRPIILERPEIPQVLPRVLLLTKTISMFATPSLLQPEAQQIPETVRPVQAEVRVKEDQASEPYPEEVEVVEGVISVNRETKKKVDTEEEESRRKILLVKDKQTLKRRIDRFKKAFEVALGAIGFAKKVDQSDPNLLSELVSPFGPDGSLEEVVKELNSGKFDSEDKVVDVVLKHAPVKEGTPYEEPATEKDRDEVTKYRFFKPPLVLEIVEKRLVKKRIGFGEVVKPKIENNLEDLGLQEIFSPKAA